MIVGRIAGVVYVWRHRFARCSVVRLCDEFIDDVLMVCVLLTHSMSSQSWSVLKELSELMFVNWRPVVWLGWLTA